MVESDRLYRMEIEEDEGEGLRRRLRAAIGEFDGKIAEICCDEDEEEVSEADR